MSQVSPFPVKPFAAYVAEKERVQPALLPTDGRYNPVTQTWDWGYGPFVIEAGGCGKTSTKCRWTGCRMTGASGRDCTWSCSDSD
jgi:hypothetical protein